MGPIASPETSVSNHLTPRNNPEDGRIQFNRGGSLRSRQVQNFMKICPVGAELFHADAETETAKLIFALRNFANDPKNVYS